METRRLKRHLQALLGDYIGQRIREKGFDPQGKASTALDDLAHYDLAISVALWWLDKGEGQDVIESDLTDLTSSGSGQYPNHLEREAMILSTFAGMVLNSLPVEEVLSLYTCKPSASYLREHAKGTIVHPFTLSYHPFAMLKAYKAVAHSRRHSQLLQRWRTGQSKPEPTGQRTSAQSSPSSSSPSSSLSSSSPQPSHSTLGAARLGDLPPFLPPLSWKLPETEMVNVKGRVLPPSVQKTEPFFVRAELGLMDYYCFERACRVHETSGLTERFD